MHILPSVESVLTRTKPIINFVQDTYNSPLGKKVAIISAISITMFGSIALATLGNNIVPHISVIILGVCTETRLKRYALNTNSFSLYKTTLLVSMIAFGAASVGLSASLLWNFLDNPLKGGPKISILRGNLNVLGMLILILSMFQLGLGTSKNRLKSLLQNIYNTFTNNDWDISLREMFSNIIKNKQISKHIEESRKMWFGFLDQETNLIDYKTSSYRLFIQKITGQKNNAKALEAKITDLKTWRNANSSINVTTLAKYREEIRFILANSTDPADCYKILWENATHLIKSIKLDAKDQTSEPPLKSAQIFTVNEFFNLLEIPALSMYNVEKFKNFASIPSSFKDAVEACEKLNEEYEKFSQEFNKDKAELNGVSHFTEKNLQKHLMVINQLSAELAGLLSQVQSIFSLNNLQKIIFHKLFSEQIHQIDAFEALKKKGLTIHDLILIRDTASLKVMPARDDLYVSLQEKGITDAEVLSLLKEHATKFDPQEINGYSKSFFESYLESYKITSLNSSLEALSRKIETAKAPLATNIAKFSPSLPETAYDFLGNLTIFRNTSHYELLQKALNLPHLDEDELANGLARLGLKNEADLKLHDIIKYNSNNTINTDETRNCLLAFIDKSIKEKPIESPSSLSQNTPNRFSVISNYLSEKLSMLSSKVSSCLKVLISRGWILAPMLLFPIASAAGVASGAVLSIAVLATFGENTLQRLDVASIPYLRLYRNQSLFRHSESQNFVNTLLSLPLLRKLDYLFIYQAVFTLETFPIVGNLFQFTRGNFVGKELVMEAHSMLKRTWHHFQTPPEHRRQAVS